MSSLGLHWGIAGLRYLSVIPPAAGEEPEPETRNPEPASPDFHFHFRGCLLRTACVTSPLQETPNSRTCKHTMIMTSHEMR